LGEGKFSNAQLVYPRPSASGLSNGALSLQELEGNGVKYLVDYNGNNKGFYKLTPEEDWEPFRYFEGGLPNRNFNDANAKFIDLNGDGLPDLMISEDSAFLWYESKGEKGFKEAYKVNKPFDEEFGPAILFNDSTQSIQLADMSGDGLTDIVRIRNGEVCYWPNMGYGKFGSKITIAYAPIFDHPDTYNPKYIRLADIDGSGTSDIVYLSNGKASVWLNDCGNAFNQHPFIIDNLPRVNTATEVSIIDFLGTGTSCLVYSSSLPADKEQPWKYIDLMGSKKPHLMNMYSNSLGKEVSFDYKSSSHFYLKDKAEGKPWTTKLPFAVHVLTKVVTRDTITKLRLVNEYSYHHGYYDYEEREFRGFGRVEQRDVETITETSDINADTQLDQAPILIKSWYHTGAYICSKKMLDHYAEEYYQNNDVEEHTSPGAIIDWDTHSTHNADDIRQAHRACKGMMLRQEVYALEDFEDEGNIPISTTKQNCYIKQLQPRANSPHPVFIALESEKIDYQYEQIANDPRITHTILLKVNEYGQAILNASIAYPRLVKEYDAATPPAPVDPSDPHTQGQQMAMRVIVAEQNYTAAVNDVADDEFHYRIPMAAESKTWEVRIDIPPNTYYTKSDFEVFIDDDLTEVPYQELITLDESKRLIEHSYITYLKDDDNITELNLFEPNKRGHVFQQYQLAFNDDILSSIFDAHDGDVGTLAESNGFIKDLDNKYWLPSGRAILTNHPPDDFYLPKSYNDALGNETLVNYETNYRLYVESVEDSLENTTSITRFDYRVMAPQRMLDINENTSYFSYDVVGRLSAIALGAKGEADDLTGYNPVLTQSDRETFFASPREEAINILVHATACYVYDQYSLPAKVATILRERHYFDVVELSLHDNTMCSFEYSNGSGQVVLKKVQAEQGNAFLPDGSNPPIELHPGTGQWLDGDDDPAPAPYDDMEPHRWVGTGRIVFNNKGNAVKQYEPYFSVTHAYEDDLQIVQIGVSPEIYYDALGRNIKTVMPDGTFTKVVYHPWFQELWDAGDTVIGSEWRANRLTLGSGADYEAAIKSEAYANTPQTIYFDNLGRPVCNRQQLFDDPLVPANDVFVYTQLMLDIESNLLNVIDGLERECMAFKYNMLGQRLYQTHIDSGERWNLTNAMGKPLWQWNSKDIIFTFTYDALNRPLDFIADDGTGEITYQKMLYGEGDIHAVDHNRRGKLLELNDGSGLTGFKEYDFKGNVLYSSKTFTEAIGPLPDWSDTVDLTSIGMGCANLFDALNRPISIENTIHKTTEYTYNEAGLIETISVNDGSNTPIIESISYNAKGQREEVFFGNESKTKYFYDEKTFRLTRIYTTRDSGGAGDILQDIYYTYDAVGNITFVVDEADAQQTIYEAGDIVKPEQTYTYDALYRLIEATGRENYTSTGNFYEENPAQALGGNDVQNYLRSFEYDLVGNMTKMQHGPGANSFTKHFHYENNNNQLTRVFIGTSVSPLESYTYDEHGNMLASYDRQFTYNLLDQLNVVDVTGGSWKAFYMYNAEGQRDRKTVSNSAGFKDRFYFQNYERYRELDNANDLVLERYTLNVMDGEKKVVQWDTPTTLPSGSGEVETIRYQYGNNLGSVGLELDQNADIISYEEYYPFGGTSYSAPENDVDVPLKRYKYCGKEQDEETGLYYYGARYYAPWLCRFTSVDPKALEYVHQSSYVFADNNPIVKYDVNGEGTADESKSNFYILKDDAQAQKDILELPNEDNQKKEINKEKGYVRIDNEGKVTLDFKGLTEKQINKILEKDEGLKLIYDLIHAKKKGTTEDIKTLYQTEGNFDFNPSYKEGIALGNFPKEPPKTWLNHKIGEVNTEINMKNYSYVASVTTYGFTERINNLNEVIKLEGSTILPKEGYQSQVAIAAGEIEFKKAEYIQGKPEKLGREITTTLNLNLVTSTSRSLLIKHELRESLFRSAEGRNYDAAHKATNLMYGDWQVTKFKWTK
jgi:RHS repeat-associated protein